MNAATLRWRAWRAIGNESGFLAIVPNDEELQEFLRGCPGGDFADADAFVAWLRAEMPTTARYVIRVRCVTSQGIRWTLHHPTEQAVAA